MKYFLSENDIICQRNNDGFDTFKHSTNCRTRNKANTEIRKSLFRFIYILISSERNERDVRNFNL